jgi:hypothetical protein
MPTEAPVDPRGPRFAAWVTSVVLAFVLVGQLWWLLAIQAVIFAVGAFGRLNYSPYAMAFQTWVRPQLRPIDEREETSPLRFAQGVGFVFAVIGLIGYLSGATVLGVIATACALIAALLNAAFGYCLGCQLYLVIRRNLPATGR